MFFGFRDQVDIILVLPELINTFYVTLHKDWVCCISYIQTFVLINPMCQRNAGLNGMPINQFVISFSSLRLHFYLFNMKFDWDLVPAHCDSQYVRQNINGSSIGVSSIN